MRSAKTGEPSINYYYLLNTAFFFLPCYHTFNSYKIDRMGTNHTEESQDTQACQLHDSFRWLCARSYCVHFFFFIYYVIIICTLMAQKKVYNSRKPA